MGLDRESPDPGPDAAVRLLSTGEGVPVANYKPILRETSDKFWAADWLRRNGYRIVGKLTNVGRYCWTAMVKVRGPHCVRVGIEWDGYAYRLVDPSVIERRETPSAGHLFAGARGVPILPSEAPDVR